METESKMINKTDRNIEIAQALDGKMPRKDVAEKYGLSYSHTFRAEQAGRQAMKFTASGEQHTEITPYTNLALTGLRRFGGMVDDEYDRVFKSVFRRIQLYREMGDDP